MRKSKIVIVIVLITLALSFDIYKPFLYHRLSYNKVLSLDKPAAHYDIDYLWYHLEDEYPYLNTAFESIDKKAEEYHLYLNNQIERTTDFSANTYMQYLQKIPTDFRHRGDFTLVLPNQYYYLYDVWTRGKNVTKQLQNNYNELTKSVSWNTYNILKKLDISQLAFSVPSNSTKGFLTEHISEDIAYLKIENGSEARIDSDCDALRDFFKSIHGKNYLIIDLPESNIYSSEYFIKNIISPNLTTDYGFSSYALYTEEGFKKRQAEDAFGGLETGSINELAEITQEVNENDLARLKYYVKSNHHIEAVNEEPLFSGEIILLTDNYIFGVGEYLTRIADQSGFATLVGKPTRGKGVIGDMDVSVISLPKSGMVFTYQLKYDLWDDGTTLVKPISPDFLALDQETPLEASMRYIEENRSVIIRR